MKKVTFLSLIFLQGITLYCGTGEAPQSINQSINQSTRQAIRSAMSTPVSDFVKNLVTPAPTAQGSKEPSLLAVVQEALRKTLGRDFVVVSHMTDPKNIETIKQLGLLTTSELRKKGLGYIVEDRIAKPLPDQHEVTYWRPFEVKPDEQKELTFSGVIRTKVKQPKDLKVRHSEVRVYKPESYPHSGVSVEQYNKMMRLGEEMAKKDPTREVRYTPYSFKPYYYGQKKTEASWPRMTEHHETLHTPYPEITLPSIPPERLIFPGEEVQVERSDFPEGEEAITRRVGIFENLPRTRFTPIQENEGFRSLLR